MIVASYVSSSSVGRADRRRTAILAMGVKHLTCQIVRKSIADNMLQ
jgi:hypothetical protein